LWFADYGLLTCSQSTVKLFSPFAKNSDSPDESSDSKERLKGTGLI